ncbi:DNA-binding HxlR family transcriptional regulator [Parabacteroides sp. PF5-5]|nr:DNA-binding HxlR family transcriptional regulator [Parabacteroides sp. PH5-39]MDH6316522.1 DNA-binding HxlR family transcriptional regulator [Parabacteroides sp. PF5-13]MDH6320032.1 DNA-binding HxlR family transcriptional regulator [Parabacteroides sp. PH5-13]MDH6323735.1 DNA-binding HxlR family transcriptional regulator [Parabacteroides sp. PH5-8]MDH6327709.1 DNA-binding HxlR family transcriptional regulator [Parabacteroides sp. PH5-41]MDH6335510.1 DNA-binding HxlR family transcriptional r
MYGKSRVSVLIKQEGTEQFAAYFCVTIVDKKIVMDKKSLINFEASEYCPVRNVIARLGDKWSILTLTTLKVNGKLRFSDIQRTIGDVSQRMLTVTLRAMEADGIISREIHAEVPPRVEYELTELGESLYPHLQALIDWATENIDTIMVGRNNL